jgi:hypothetical protein
VHIIFFYFLFYLTGRIGTRLRPDQNPKIIISKSSDQVSVNFFLFCRTHRADHNKKKIIKFGPLDHEIIVKKFFILYYDQFKVALYHESIRVKSYILDAFLSKISSFKYFDPYIIFYL